MIARQAALFAFVPRRRRDLVGTAQATADELANAAAEARQQRARWASTLAEATGRDPAEFENWDACYGADAAVAHRLADYVVAGPALHLQRHKTVAREPRGRVVAEGSRTSPRPRSVRGLDARCRGESRRYSEGGSTETPRDLWWVAVPSSRAGRAPAAGCHADIPRADWETSAPTRVNGAAEER